MRKYAWIAVIALIACTVAFIRMRRHEKNDGPGYARTRNGSNRTRNG